eukprot:GEMP01052539.1.p1 GENE.GEMP01052539.1~~GEMP01052539.1.p1  ORF type:complete len:182 (+),score=37.71 GEMP01052539.1:99-644(+)
MEGYSMKQKRRTSFPTPTRTCRERTRRLSHPRGCIVSIVSGNSLTHEGADAPTDPSGVNNDPDGFQHKRSPRGRARTARLLSDYDSDIQGVDADALRVERGTTEDATNMVSAEYSDIGERNERIRCAALPLPRDSRRPLDNRDSMDKIFAQEWSKEERAQGKEDVLKTTKRVTFYFEEVSD